MNQSIFFFSYDWPKFKEKGRKASCKRQIFPAIWRVSTIIFFFWAVELLVQGHCFFCYSESPQQTKYEVACSRPQKLMGTKNLW
jgi:hypothetical protein